MGSRVSTGARSADVRHVATRLRFSATVNAKCEEATACARYLIAERAGRAGRGALPWCEIRPRACGQWQGAATPSTLRRRAPRAATLGATRHCPPLPASPSPQPRCHPQCTYQYHVVHIKYGN
ncbi:unnamed protein product [Chrysodeixis includens]|uniref:Uncharacterized protein n=1 Tax=Chrysodeixis includens TaxID=689277 RepID=A0A9N8KVE7_CHRIL|nr:unnamed protein product [Chrysodeixis includens]